jgi:pimeloyl-ACP methyl ester carboxylesterase
MAGVVALALAGAAAAAPEAEAPRVTEIGRGPTLVLIHGLGGRRMSWMPTARKLVGSHRVVMVDLPGHGQTPLPEPFSLDAAAAAVGRLLAAQKGESTVVVGYGTGGLVGLLALAAHPERARGLALIDVSLRFEPRIPEQQQRSFLRAFEDNYDAMLRQMFVRMGRDSAQGMTIHAQAAQVPPATIKAYLRDGLNFDGTPVLKSLDKPVLFVGSARFWDAGQDWRAVAKQRGFEAFPAIRPRRIADSGFLIAADQPDSLAAVLAEFTAQALRGQ